MIIAGSIATAAGVSISESGQGKNVSVLSVVAPVKRVDDVDSSFVLTVSQPVMHKDDKGIVTVTTEQEDVTFLVNDNTTFTNLSGLSDIHVVDTIGAGGNVQPDGSVLATKVSK